MIPARIFSFRIRKKFLGVSKKISGNFLRFGSEKFFNFFLLKRIPWQIDPE